MAQTQTLIQTPYFCTGQEFESVPESVSGNVNEPLNIEFNVRGPSISERGAAAYFPHTGVS